MGLFIILFRLVVIVTAIHKHVQLFLDTHVGAFCTGDIIHG